MKRAKPDLAANIGSKLNLDPVTGPSDFELWCSAPCPKESPRNVVCLPFVRNQRDWLQHFLQ